MTPAITELKTLLWCQKNKKRTPRTSHITENCSLLHTICQNTLLSSEVFCNIYSFASIASCSYSTDFAFSLQLSPFSSRRLLSTGNLGVIKPSKPSTIVVLHNQRLLSSFTTVDKAHHCLYYLSHVNVIFFFKPRYFSFLQRKKKSKAGELSIVDVDELFNNNTSMGQRKILSPRRESNPCQCSR